MCRNIKTLFNFQRDDPEPHPHCTRRAALSVLCGALISAAAAGIAMAAPNGIIDALDQEPPRATLGTRWELIADRVMGGVSSGELTREHVGGRAALRMRGDVSLENTGGFVQIALDLAPGGGVVDAREWTGIEIDVFGNDERYNLHLRTADVTRPWQSYRAEFVAMPEWRTIRLPFSKFEPHRIDALLNLARLRRLGVVAIGRLRFYRQESDDGGPASMTGGASGIGHAAATEFARHSLKVCIADIGEDRLSRAAAQLAEAAPEGASAIMAMETDVSRLADLQRLEAAVRERFGGTDILMNNAGIQPGSALFGPPENWQKVIDVNLWGVIHGSRVFVPGMISRGRPGLVINTGSKQGITTPPGDPAYNVSKAGVKAFTEALAHELRNTPGCRLTAHLLIPGFVFTELTAQGRTEKPASAWTPEQTAEFMMRRLEAGDFYILCPDNDVPRELDERRILWAAGDIVENRPALSRWHPDYADAFADFVRERL